jgi:hypothetical protein
MIQVGIFPGRIEDHHIACIDKAVGEAPGNLAVAAGHDGRRTWERHSCDVEASRAISVFLD